jgi:hypothetical protein
MSSEGVRGRNGLIIGVVREGWFERNVNEDEHFSHSLQSWATDVHIVEDFRKRSDMLGMKNILPDGRILSVTMETVNQRGFVRTLSERFGPQVFVPKRYWNEWNARQPSLL